MPQVKVFEGVDAFKDANKFIGDHELATSQRFVTVKSDHFKYPAGPKDRARIYWEEHSSSLLPIGFDGVPFQFVGRQIRECWKGPDKHLSDKAKSKKDKEKAITTPATTTTPLTPPTPPPDHAYAEKSQRLVHCTKKENCPATIILRAVICFPEYKITSDTTDYRKREKRAILSKDISSAEVSWCLRVYLYLPDESLHNHIISELTSVYQRLDKTVIDHIHALIVDGVRRVDEMERAVRRFSKVTFPTATQLNARYYPTRKTIRNHMYTALCMQQSASIDIGQLSDQLNQQQQQFYTIDEALTIVNQADKDPTADATTYVTDDTGVQAPVMEAGEVGMLDDPGETYTTIPLHQSGVSISIAPEMQVPAVATQTKPGDLDPQTGMFRGNKHTQPTVVHAGVVGTGKRVSETQEVIVVGHGQQTHGRTAEVLTSSADLLSISIAQAHLDLDPCEFIENGQNYRTAGNVVTETVVSREPQGDLNMNAAMETAVSTQDSGSTQSGLVGVVPETIPQPAVSDPHLVTSNVILPKVVSQPITTTTPSIRIQAGSGAFVPLRDSVAKSAIKPSNINITTQKQAVPSVQVPTTSGLSLHVTVEPSGIDTSHMKMEDFSSQQLTDRGEYAGIDHVEEISSLDSPSAGSSGLSDSQGEGSQYFDSQSPYVVGKRKRKSQSIDEAPGISPWVGTGWVRAALGVLNKVSRYRGANRDKNDLNAATWFTQPVDPADTPDYYTIVETPMDFDTIRRRLEGGKYGEYDEFHGDMMLVHDNCHLYNPDQSVVRRNCDEVFVYFQQEHDRLLEKWQKTHIASPLSKKARASDKSPVRS